MQEGVKTADIVLIGAGIAGLTVARALQCHGFRVRVYEQSARLGEVGAGLTLSPNAMHALHAIGLAPDLARLGMQPERGGVKHWKTGKLMVEVSRGSEMLERYGAPYMQLHRADLHELLVRDTLAHDPGSIRLSHRFRGLIQRGGRVEVQFENGEQTLADVVIGCDGIRSSVRAQLFGPERPKFTGYIAWRGLVPAERLEPEGIWPTSCLSIGHDRSFTRYLIRGGRTINYVALAERSDWQLEGWSIRSEVSELLAEFEGWYEEMRRIIRATPAELCHKWALFDRDPLPRWISGQVALLGDAAHPMLPFLGQGAAMGIEDGVVLARAFAAAGSLPEALQRYEAARLPRANDVLLQSRETGLRYHRAEPDDYASRPHVSAESLGLMAYNPAATPV